AVSAGASVAAAAAARILVVRNRVAVVAAAAGVAGSAAGRAAVGGEALVGIVRAGCDGRPRRGVVDPTGRSGDAFGLCPVEGEGRILHVIRNEPPHGPGQLSRAASPEAEPVH